MFDNLLYQNASSLLRGDIINNRLPGAILLSGPASSGKLTCALEIARILSCTGQNKYNQRGTGFVIVLPAKKTRNFQIQMFFLRDLATAPLRFLRQKGLFYRLLSIIQVF